MPPTTYSYTISVDFPNQKVNATALQKEILADSSITTTFDYINTNITPDICDITFADALTVGEETALDAVVAAHQGTLMTYTMCGVIPVGNVGGAVIDVTEDLSWQLIDVAVTRPSFFSIDTEHLFGNVNGRYDGDGGEIRIVEVIDGQPDELKTDPPFPITDSGGSWADLRISTNIPPRYTTTPNQYRIEARRNGAASLQLHSINFGIVKFEVS